MEHLVQPINTDIKVAEIEVMYRSKVKPSDRGKVTTSEDAIAIFRQTWDEVRSNT